jgi:hypothetical protein
MTARHPAGSKVARALGVELPVFLVVIPQAKQRNLLFAPPYAVGEIAIRSARYFRILGKPEVILNCRYQAKALIERVLGMNRNY